MIPPLPSSLSFPLSEARPFPSDRSSDTAISDLSQATAPVVSPMPTIAVQLVPPPGSTRNRPGIGVFLQEHALKIVFALATVLVLIALRSILGWNETNAAFLALMPLLPVALTGMFWHFGRKTQLENPWAAFVYQGLTAVLLGFDLFIVNRFWLGAISLSLPPKMLMLVANAVSTTTCAVTWRRHRYPAMWHLVQAGLLTSLFAALQGLKLLLWHQLDWRPTPLLLFGCAYIGAAGTYFSFATRSHNSGASDSEESSDEWRPAWILWANLSVAVAFVLSTLSLALTRGLQTDDFLWVFLLAGILYGIIAQALGNPRLVYVASTLCLGSGLVWIPSHVSYGAMPYGLLFLTFGIVASALYNFCRRKTVHRPLMTVWKQVALAGNTLALILLGGQSLLVPFAGSPIDNSNAFLLRAALTLVCGLQFLILSFQESEPYLCYSACLSGGIALLSVLQGLHTAADRYPLALAAYAALLLLLSARTNTSTVSPISQNETKPTLWHAVRTTGHITLYLSLIWAAGIWFGLWALDQGEYCLHVGAGNLLGAWGFTIYHTLGAEMNLLDIYLLPFGLYLLLFGHILSRRLKQTEAQTTWGAGLLVSLTPALLTRWMPAPNWHAALLLAECVGFVLWGVAQRIRVFVAAGLGTVTIYAASVLIGTLPDTVTTILALLAGVGLFVFGFYALTH